MAVLSLRLLGNFEARTASGEPIPLPNRKAAALLAYLALHTDRPVSRDRLAELLWGAKDHAAARANLRQTLTALRKALPEECLSAVSIDGEALTAHAAALDLDVALFRRIEEGELDIGLYDPASVYHGKLLDGLRITEPAFDEWLREAQDDLHQRAIRVFSRELERLERSGSAERAIDVAKRLLSLEPHDESVHRALMRLYSRAGRNGLALAQYTACRETLQRELGVPPEPATSALYEAVRLKRRSAPMLDPLEAVEPDSRPGEAEAVISDSIQDAVDEVDAAFRFAGEQMVESIARPVRTYALGSKGTGTRGIRRRRGWFAAVAAASALLAAGAVGWQAWDRGAGTSSDRNLFAVPSGPKIAVLPLENLSGDPSQDYFVDGLTVEIVDRLARFPDLSVIARNSALRYKGQAVDVRAAGQELGVRYLVTGSVRREIDRIRVSAQLVETEPRSYLWGETYDRALTAESLFAIQDEIATAIAKTLADTYGVLRQAGLSEARGKPPGTLSSYDCVLLTMEWLRNVSREAHGKARDCLEHAVENDPGYARAWSNLAVISVYGHNLGYDLRPGLLDRAHQAAHHAVALAPGDADAHWGSAWTHFFLGDLDAFKAEVDRVIELAPKGASFLGNAGLFLAYAGDWERGLALIEEAKAFDPFFPGGYYFGAFFDHYRRGEYETALKVAQKTAMPDYVWALALIAAAYGQLGRADLAEPTVKRILELDPDFEATAHAQRWRWFRYQEGLLDHFMDGLRKAGLDIAEKPTTSD